MAGVPMQKDHAFPGEEKPCVFVSHALSDQATRWGIRKLELYALVFLIKQLSSYL